MSWYMMIMHNDDMITFLIIFLTSGMLHQFKLLQGSRPDGPLQLLLHIDPVIEEDSPAPLQSMSVPIQAVLDQFQDLF